MSIYPFKRNGKLTGQYRVEVQFNGQRARGTFATLAEAKDAEKRWRDQFAAGATPLASAKNAPARVETLKDLYEEAKDRAWRGKEDELGLARRAFLALSIIGFDRSVDSITLSDVDRMIGALSKRELAPATINRYLSAVSKLLKWAVTFEYRKVPVPDLTDLWLDEGEGRIRWITEEEEGQMYAILSDMEQNPSNYATVRFGSVTSIAIVIRVAILTGLRASELLSLVPDQVEPGWVRVWKTKNNKPRSVPISEETYGLFQSLFRLGMPKYHSLRHYWDAMRERMGLAHDPFFVFHSCRHTCATRLANTHVNLKVVQDWMGHKSIQTTLRYTHISDKALTEALGKLDAKTPTTLTLVEDTGGNLVPTAGGFGPSKASGGTKVHRPVLRRLKNRSENKDDWRPRPELNRGTRICSPARPDPESSTLGNSTTEDGKEQE